MRYFFLRTRPKKGKIAAVFVIYIVPALFGFRSELPPTNVMLLSAPPDTAGAGRISNETDICRRVIPL
ncbi:MAG: hypothetical protein WBB70_03000 [Desulfobacterales bacterium]|jgi:hypothetical protein